MSVFPDPVTFVPFLPRDSQAVPTSPQVDPAPSDFLSLHSAQTSKETLNDKPIAKRVLFTSDQSLHLHEVSPSSGFCLDCESSLSSSSSSSSFDNHHQGQPSIFPRGRTLETPHREVAGLESSETNSHDVPSLFEDQPTQFAQVVSLLSTGILIKYWLVYLITCTLKGLGADEEGEGIILVYRLMCLEESSFIGSWDVKCNLNCLACQQMFVGEGWKRFPSRVIPGLMMCHKN